jgi:hypothetical protein
MWSVFPIHDLLTLGSNLLADKEHVNGSPAGNKDSRNIRLKFMLEDLLNEDEFSNNLHKLISDSGRNMGN